MTALSEQLEQAADLIEQHGWGKGEDSWYPDADRDGYPSGGLCIEGALLAVTGDQFGVSNLIACPLYDAVYEYLLKHDERWVGAVCNQLFAEEVYLPRLFVWNDDYASEQEVLDALRGAAKEQRMKEESL